MKKQSLIKGTVILGVAGIFSKFLGLFFRWPLIMLIGDEGMAYYQLSYPLYLFFIGLATGIPVAVSKMICESNVLQDDEGIVQITNKALLFMFIFGGVFSSLIIVFAEQFIHIFKWDPKAYYALLGIGAAPLFISLMSVFRGFFQGLQNMTPTAVSQIIEQLGRIVVGVGAAYLLIGKGVEFSAGGAAFGAAAGGVLGLIYLSIKYYQVTRKFTRRKFIKNKNIMKELMKISIPISFGAAMGTIMGLVDSILVPQKLLEAGFKYNEMNVLYGQLTGKAMVLVNVPLTVSVALSLSLVPIIAEAKLMNRSFEVLNKVETAIKLSMVIAFPAACGLYFMAPQILNLLFPGHADGYLILKYASLTIPFIILTQTSTAILQGSGHYFEPMKNLVVGCILKIVITLALVPLIQINIYGAIIGSIAGYFVTAVLNSISLRSKLNVSINYYSTTIKPAYAAVIMIIGVVLTYDYVYNYTMSNGIASLISIGFGFVIYSALIVFLGVFKYSYLKSKIIRLK